MEKSEIEEYIRKLTLIEKELTDDESEDFNHLLDLENLLNNLRDDAMKSQNQRNSSYSYSLDIKLKKLHPNAVIPTYAKDGDAGMDLVATEIISEDLNKITYGTGISIEIPLGYVGFVFPRSSIRKYELDLTNSVGVIDSGYRGEIQATFNKTHNKLTNYSVGDRVAQIIILPYPKVKFTESNELSDSDRGVGGFGSTGT